MSGGSDPKQWQGKHMGIKEEERNTNEIVPVLERQIAEAKQEGREYIPVDLEVLEHLIIRWKN